MKLVKRLTRHERRYLMRSAWLYYPIVKQELLRQSNHPMAYYETGEILQQCLIKAWSRVRRVHRHDERYCQLSLFPAPETPAHPPG